MSLFLNLLTKSIFKNYNFPQVKRLRTSTDFYSKGDVQTIVWKTQKTTFHKVLRWTESGFLKTNERTSVKNDTKARRAHKYYTPWS